MRIGYIAAALLVVAVSGTDTQSQSLREVPLKGPASRKPAGWFAAGPSEPGTWSNIAAHASGTIYIASTGGGVRKSTDFGATWATVNNGLPVGANSFAMDASDPNTIYCGAISAVTGVPGGVYKSTDGGQSWVHTPGSTNIVAMSLEADPTNPGIVFMGALGGTLRRTTNGGVTWSLVFSGTSPIGSIQVDPADGTRVYMATLAGAWRSLDGGTTWSRMSSLTAPNVWGIDVSAMPGVLYAATDADGIWKSLDYGDTWQSVSPPLTAYNVAADPANSNNVYAATRTAVWASTDAGATWHESGLPGRGAFSITADGGAVYAGTANGAGVSRDGGTTWSDLDHGLGGARAFGYAITLDSQVRDKVFVSGLASAVIVSHDGGASWTPSHTGYLTKSARGVAVDPTDSSHVYAGSFFAGGLFKSVDGGASWSRRKFGSAAIYVWVPAVDPAEPNIVYAGTQGDGLWKSADYGDTWTRLTGVPATVQGVAIDPTNNQRVIASTPNGLWKSETGGQTWANVLATPAWNVTFAPGDIAYATARQAGVFKSVDGGDSWFPINNGITNLVMGRAAPVAVHPEDPDTIYAASEAGGGVYKSKDGGANWTQVNLHLADTSVYGLAMDPFRPKTLYVSTPSGVYKTVSGGD